MAENAEVKVEKAKATKGKKGKRIVNAYKNLDKNQAYSLKDAVDFAVNEMNQISGKSSILNYGKEILLNL